MLYQLRDAKLGIVFTSEENATIMKKIQDRRATKQWETETVHENEKIEEWQNFKYLPWWLSNVLEGFSKGPSSPSWTVVAPLILELFDVILALHFV
jgi:hypothetical protein